VFWEVRRHMVLGHIVAQPSKAICRYRTAVQLVGENSVIPLTLQSYRIHHSFSPETDSSTARYRKTLLGLGERLSALASGLGDLQPSRSESPDSTSDSRNEAFTTASPVLKSSSALQSKSFATPKIDRQSLKPDSGISPGPRLHL
jgi:hypothetical protein